MSMYVYEISEMSAPNTCIWNILKYLFTCNCNTTTVIYLFLIIENKSGHDWRHVQIEGKFATKKTFGIEKQKWIIVSHYQFLMLQLILQLRFVRAMFSKSPIAKLWRKSKGGQLTPLTPCSLDPWFRLILYHFMENVEK